MGWLTVYGVAGLLNVASALPTDHVQAHVLHEKRSLDAISAWQQAARVDSDAIIPLRIGLSQSNLDNGYDELMAVSHPESPRYGQHLTAEQVHQMFAPSNEAVDAIRSWLTGSGIEDEAIVHSDNKGWLALDVPAAHVERLFATELFEYEHEDTGKLRLGCEQYHVPSHLQDHIDYITPGVKLSAPMRKRAAKGWPYRPQGPSRAPPQFGPWQMPPAAHGLPPDLQHCGVNITPTCVRALYDLPIGKVCDPETAPGFYEQGDFYSQTDLNLFFKHFAPEIPQNTAPVPQFIDGAKSNVPADSPDNGGESDIDLDIGFSLVYPTIPKLYQVDDYPTATAELEHYNLFNTFLDALDGSYCNYTAYGITGDSWIDPKYPDPKKGGYKGKLQCGVYKPAQVISISYGEAEHDIPEKYDKRQCNEFMKLQLQGHTILEASGDYGVASFPGDGGKKGCLSLNGQKQTIYNPDQLSSCPYVTSVGATAIYADQTVRDPESAMQVNLGPGAELFASHGGFSNYFPRAKYQEKAVSSYFAKHDPGLPYYTVNGNLSKIGEDGGVYSRMGRAFPDVSANGAFMLAFVNQTLGHWFGTSLSSPIWASVVTHLNQERSAAGKSPVGFLNPTLYANPWALNDIKNGSNPGCGSSGFHAVEGWDPITGLGTPNYPNLVKLFLSLP